MEYALNHKVFSDLVELSHKNTPRDMFIICTEFLTTVCQSIKAIPIMHNNRIHVQLVKALQQMGGMIRSKDKVEELYIKTMLRFLDMITEHALNQDRQIVQFYTQMQQI